MGETEKDTIAAISTPVGEGGIGIVRISGPLSLAIADRLFRSSRIPPPSSFPTHTLHYGFIVDPEKQERVDEVLLAVMRSPHSYTREDVVEIHGHGGLVALRRILELVLQQGARLALPGEFTRRAFLNGRIDLAQAEAVLEVIRSKSERGLALALRQLDGSLSHRLRGMRQELLLLLAEAEASLDFPEEGLEFIPAEELEVRLVEVEKAVRRLKESFNQGRIVHEGIATVLVGRPNVGKSSLFNALLQRERAIVTPQPGTTRDFLEEVVNLEGLPFLLVDTAGMRADDLSLEPAERHGVERTRDWIERADLLLVLLDASQALSDEDRLLLQEIRGRKGILVMNKVDLPVRLSRGEALEAVPGLPCVQVSALSGEGLEELKGIMVEAVGREGLDTTEGLVITQLRHRQALDKAERALAEARKALAQGLSWEFVCLDLRESLEALGEITGETATADILEQIFSRFCIGK